MIFGNNSTTLGASSVAMAEGYDCSYGVALALVESAQNDYAMFKAMVGADFKEINICRESAGYVRENEVSALHEATEGGIWKKIGEFFKKLASKIKAIFHKFITKITGIFKVDEKYVKAHLDEIKEKKNIGNLKVKWRKVINPIKLDFSKEDSNKDFDALAKLWAEDKEERYKNFSGMDIDSVAAYKEKLEEKYMDKDTSEVKISDIGGIDTIAKFLTSYSATINNFKTESDKIVSELDKFATDANNRAKEILSNLKTDTKKDDGTEYSADDVVSANHVYDMAVIKQELGLAKIDVIQGLMVTEYKQNKAAFVKAAVANDKKLEESAAYLNAVEEVAAYEVEDIISSAMSDEEISKISNASKAVKDANVSDCPNALTYGPDYDARSAYGPADGSVDTDINSKEESAFFGKLLY